MSFLASRGLLWVGRKGLSCLAHGFQGLAGPVALACDEAWHHGGCRMGQSVVPFMSASRQREMEGARGA